MDVRYGKWGKKRTAFQSNERSTARGPLVKLFIKLCRSLGLPFLGTCLVVYRLLRSLQTLWSSSPNAVSIPVPQTLYSSVKPFRLSLLAMQTRLFRWFSIFIELLFLCLPLLAMQTWSLSDLNCASPISQLRRVMSTGIDTVRKFKSSF